MAWQIVFTLDNGETKTADIDDLPNEFFKEVARDEGARFWDVGDDPGENPDRMYRIIVACAALIGEEPPDEPKTRRDALRLAEMFKLVPNVDEQPMMDGFPQVPGETEVGSTSTSPGDMDGLQT